MDGKEKAMTERQALRRIEVRERFRMSSFTVPFNQGEGEESAHAV